jgi:uncharacterized protein
LSADFAFGRHDFQIYDKTGLYWPARRALIVADLHLEKASWFAERGQMLPPYDSQATLDRIAALVAATGAREVWCLGDNFHDDAGPSRLSTDAKHSLAQLTAASEWHWITGNHDEHLPGGIGGVIEVQVEIEGLVLRHQADIQDLRPEVSGHYHPKVRVGRRGHSVSRPCFVRGATKLILPAFGSLTGGMSASDSAITEKVGTGAEALLAAKDQLIRLPLAPYLGTIAK